jgi:hypothetical protein
MLGDLNLDRDHLSRLDLAVALRGCSRTEAAASVGITLGGEQEPLAPLTAEGFEESAAACEAAGDHSTARTIRAHAAKLRAERAARLPTEIFAPSPIAGGAVPVPPELRVLRGGAGDATSTPLVGTAPPAIGTVGTSALKLGSTAFLEASPLAGLRSGTWLDSQTFAPLEYHVPGLVAEGCGIVAGPPKVGKSWLVLALALAVASGGIALGCLPCQRRPVLYLALEDGHRRLQARARQLLGPGTPIPAGFSYLLDIPEGVTATSLITEWLQLHPGERPFVIVDTLGKTRGAGPGPGTNAYQQDYKALGDLKKVIDAVPGAGMLIVHHTRKSEAGRGGQGTGDFVEALSGTFGLSGAADYAMVLSRKRGTEDGALALTGRDVIERTVAMTRDKTGLWTLDGGSIEAAEQALYDRAETVDLSPEQQKMREVVVGRWRDSKSPTTPGDAAAALGWSATKAAVYLSRLVDAGMITKPARGVYQPAEDEGTPS